MLSRSAIIVGPATATSGAVSLAQGVYGARGNLELVACDSADGLWVFWFNADLDTDPLATPDVPPGNWSAGLRFAAGRRYVDAQILQSSVGPDHLEVLALTSDGVLESWFWSPGPGFQRRVTDAATGVTRFAAAHDRGTLLVTVAATEGAKRHLVSPPRGYPSRAWVLTAGGPALDVDATAEIVAAGIAADEITPGTARAATSTRAGGTTELTWRDRDGAIRHLGVPR
ncbi:hypothetical protein [Microbacterium hominis]|uniref:Uncharacterized protein n=1 Tax=Microbacterium hominis TaxID=162426 RepID=A0A7D4PSS7_9MICO|nr:hypothetical protein [Microbacterium hominis]QKJ18273.1 hypothetical protein HQM25_01895 [Microbacterium hominis]